MSERKQILSRAECSALRGIAILGIFLHNYCHWLKGIVRENEYTFNVGNSDGMLSVLAHPDGNLLFHLLSFFGHYGVPVFLFLSGYGLVLKYENSTREVGKTAQEGPQEGKWSYLTGSFSFLRCHYLKLFKMMIVGFVAFTMVDMITPGRHHYQVLDIIAQLLMFNNVLPDPDHIIWPGPYWFFGLMMQLYIIYRLRYNFIGGMLPFGMGLLAGRLASNTLLLTTTRNVLLMLVSTALVVVLSLNYQAWFFVPVFVITASIGLVKILPVVVNKRLEWLGSISAALFVCHPILRKIFIPMSNWGDVYAGLLLYVVSSICVAWVFKLLMDRIPNPK